MRSPSLPVPLGAILCLGCGSEPDPTPETPSPTDSPTETSPTADTGTPTSPDPTGDTGAPPRSLSVEVTGLLGSGLRLEDQAGGVLEPSDDGTWTFGTELHPGDPFEVTVAADPLGPPQRCTVVDGAGTLSDTTPPVPVTCETYHVAFLTSSTGRGDLGAWADAGGLTGLDAGDAICQAHADRAGLPGTFVAWLSDGDDDAYCRVAGASGEVISSCGQATLPTGAGPWVRPDGQRFAETLERMVGPTDEVYLPPTLDESGTAVEALSFYSGTRNEGDASRAAPCVDWTSESFDDQATGGSRDATDLATWGGGCGFDLPLLCLQTGAGIPLPPPPTPTTDAHVLFLSSVASDGNLGGLAGADALCADLAAAAGLTGSFEAFLSDSTTTAASRMDHVGPWVRPDGHQLAATTSDLLDGALLTSPNLTEQGIYDTTDYAWTGSDDPAETCDDWTSSTTGSGNVGRPHVSMAWWLDWFPRPCTEPQRLYCYED